jgi:CelD/BcsL family acetyltransferase involved in cellulose biosynthesis
VQITPLESIDAASIRDWDRLAQNAIEPNPFFSPQMLLPAARWLPEGTSVHLAVVRRGPELVLATPLVRTRYRRIPFTAFTTWRHPHRYLGTPLVSPVAMAAAPAALLDALISRKSPVWVVLEQLYIDGPVARAFRAAASERSASWVQHDVWKRPSVRARDREIYLDQTLSPRSAKALRRQRRNLERNHGPVVSRELAAAGNPACVPAEVEAFLAMEASGWKGRANTALASVPGHAAFWREACRNLAHVGRLELWELRAGDVVAARQCHVRQGDTVFHLKTTYNESLARYSPGVQLELDVLHAFHLDPHLRWLDPCTEREPSTSARLYPDTRRLGDALIGLTPMGRLAAQSTPVASRIWRTLSHRQSPKGPSHSLISQASQHFTSD